MLVFIEYILLCTFSPSPGVAETAYVLTPSQSSSQAFSQYSELLVNHCIVTQTYRALVLSRQRLHENDECKCHDQETF